jgi:O-antigen ligase
LRPWLGYGFGAFWTDPWGPAWFIRHDVQWTAPNAHDGWLDVLLQLGVVGAVLAVAHFLVSAGAAVRGAARGPQGTWAALFMALFALFSISESTVMQYNGVIWAIYIATMAKLFEWPGFAFGPAPAVRRAVKLFPDE